LAGAADLLAQSIDHSVTYEVDSLARDTLPFQILGCKRIGCEQKVRDGIGAKAVDLFRHGHIP
jgi:hypothetical protein